MRESQALLYEQRMAIGKFKIEHRDKNINNYDIKVSKQDSNNCFLFINKKSKKQEESICIKKLI